MKFLEKLVMKMLGGVMKMLEKLPLPKFKVPGLSNLLGKIPGFSTPFSTPKAVGDASAKGNWQAQFEGVFPETVRPFLPDLPDPKTLAMGMAAAGM